MGKAKTFGVAIPQAFCSETNFGLRRSSGIDFKVPRKLLAAFSPLKRNIVPLRSKKRVARLTGGFLVCAAETHFSGRFLSKSL
ncbi:hypothetical protein SGGMMB4_02687 [Sodalis glossinidius str. 'morsitans']|uniref:Uncharacterized protein n=1 Tax=Sodalis glossinidius (strain morsitans) TaxID=343509 RepID=A0A193QIZ9_SODGM|nr:hypothetical protein SGGMMB4_02687 [Sodalis glossinidius str. 'morsitans']